MLRELFKEAAEWLLTAFQSASVFRRVVISTLIVALFSIFFLIAALDPFILRSLAGEGIASAFVALIVATIGYVFGNSSTNKAERASANYIGNPDESKQADAAHAKISKELNELETRQASHKELDRLRRQIRELRVQRASVSQALISIRTPEGIFSQTRDRLSLERDRLASNSRNNLIIGIVTSLMALSILGLPLLHKDSQVALSPASASEANNITSAPPTSQKERAITKTDKDSPIDVNGDFWRQYFTRLPVGLLLEFVGFFFLRLYVSCEMDIKNNKNEITNIESKFMAWLMSEGDELPAEFKQVVIGQLAITERNFILRKGERTISTENDSKFNDLNEAIDSMSKLVSKIVPRRDK